MHSSTIQPRTSMAYSSAGTANSARRSSLRNSIIKLKETPQQDFQRKRFAKISDIFDRLGYSINRVLSEGELLEVLDQIGRAPFDRDVAVQLFDRIPTVQNPDQPNERFYNLQDFIDTHITAEYLLLTLADETETELSNTNNQIEHFKSHQVNQVKESHGCEEPNILNVEILQVVCDDPNFRPQMGSFYNVIVVFNHYRYETEEVELDGHDFNLQFDRTFHLKVKNPQETLRIFLSSTDPNCSDLKCSLFLDRFEDQDMHSEWFYLYDQNDNLTPFKVHAKIQWRHSSTAVNTAALETLTELQSKLLDNKDAIETTLKNLVRPFLKAGSPSKKNVMAASMPNKNNTNLKTSSYL